MIHEFQQKIQKKKNHYPILTNNTLRKPHSSGAKQKEKSQNRMWATERDFMEIERSGEDF
jgi:hypothetical protein